MNAATFHGQTASLLLKDPLTGFTARVSAVPNLAEDGLLECQVENALGRRASSTYSVERVQLSDGLRRIEFKPNQVTYEADLFRIAIPDSASDATSRDEKRFPSNRATVSLIQGKSRAPGTVIDFSASAFAVDLADPSVNELDHSRPMEAVLETADGIAYQGSVRTLRVEHAHQVAQVVLQPMPTIAPRTVTVRARRRTFSPLPTIDFCHPIIGKHFHFEVRDLSVAGFCIEEEASHSIFFPGLIISQINIRMTGSWAVTCSAQVRYRTRRDSETSIAGFEIINITAAERLRLISVLNQCSDSHTYVCPDSLDLDALWSFFFETGFIYPDKFAALRDQKRNLQAIYEKIYLNTPEFARHVIYQEKGVIHGHLSMIKYYKQTWIVHHHAARRSAHRKAGLVVLDHLLRYVHEYRLSFPDSMQYLAFYFRPNNRFASRVFGGTVGAIGDKGKCSLDSFAYLHFDRRTQITSDLSVSLRPALTEDVRQLERIYKRQSGGMMIEALDLASVGNESDMRVTGEYMEAGLLRDRRLYAVVVQDSLAALIAINRSDAGLNLSDLTNCIQLFVLQSRLLDKSKVETAFGLAAEEFDESSVATLVYPLEFAKATDLSYSKVYDLCVLNVDHFSPCYIHIEGLMGRGSSANSITRQSLK